MAYNNNTYYISDSFYVNLSDLENYSNTWSANFTKYQLITERKYNAWMRNNTYLGGTNSSTKLARGGVSYLGNMIPETIEINNQKNNSTYVEPNKSSPYLQSFITSYMMWPDYTVNYNSSTKQGTYTPAKRNKLITNYPELCRKIHIHVYTDENDNYNTMYKPSKKGLMIEGVKVKLYKDISTINNMYDSEAGIPPDKTMYQEVFHNADHDDYSIPPEYVYRYKLLQLINNDNTNTQRHDEFCYMISTSINTDIYNNNNLIFSDGGLICDYDNFRQDFLDNKKYVQTSVSDSNAIHITRPVGYEWFYEGYMRWGSSSTYSSLLEPPYNNPNPNDPESICWVNDPLYEWVYCRTDFSYNINLYGSYPFVSGYNNNGVQVSRVCVRLICEIEIDLFSSRSNNNNPYKCSWYLDGSGQYYTGYYIIATCRNKSTSESMVNSIYIDSYSKNIETGQSDGCLANYYGTYSPGNNITIDDIYDVDESKIMYLNTYNPNNPYYAIASRPYGHMTIRGNMDYRRRKKYIRFYIPWYWVETDIDITIRTLF